MCDEFGNDDLITGSRVRAFRKKMKSRMKKAADKRSNLEGSSSQAALFEPPHSILFKGSLEQAKAEARRQGRWLVRRVMGERACKA